MATSKPTVTADDQLIVVPPGKPKGWRVYSVQPEPSEARMAAAAKVLEQQGLSLDWWIAGRGVFLIDCRADYDQYVTTAIESGWASCDSIPPEHER